MSEIYVEPSARGLRLTEHLCFLSEVGDRVARDIGRDRAAGVVVSPKTGGQIRGVNFTLSLVITSEVIISLSFNPSGSGAAGMK